MSAATQHLFGKDLGTGFVRWHIRVSDADTAPWLTWLSAMGLAAAAVLAAVGGLPFDIPMPTYRFGIVTPTCGLTRGSTAIARGELGLAWQYNPASFAVIGLGTLGLTRSIAGFTTRRWLAVNCTRSRFAWVLIGAAIVAFWLYQQSNADFIITSRR
jgi:hypothetical protein